MKILFIGGTGRLSNDIAIKAAEMHEVFLLTRGSSNRKQFVDEKFNMIYADIRNKKDVIAQVIDKEFDVIIDFLSYNLEQLKNSLNIFEGKYKQYVFISTATVYEKEDENEIISELKTKVGNKKWKYAYDKYLCEEYLKEYFKDKKQFFTIIRPYVTYNKTRIPYLIVPHNTLMEYSLIERIKQHKKIPVINNGEVMTTLTNTKDFAYGVIGVFLNQKAYNEAFHITSFESVMWRETLNYISEYYKIEVITQNFSIEEFSKEYKEYKDILEGDKGHKMCFDNSKIKEIVPNFNPKISLKEGVFETLDFYEKNEANKLIDYFWYGKLDRICNEKCCIFGKTIKDKIDYLCGYFKVLGLFKKVYIKLRSL